MFCYAMPILCYLSVNNVFCMPCSMASVSFVYLTYHELLLILQISMRCQDTLFLTPEPPPWNPQLLVHLHHSNQRLRRRRCRLMSLN
jgi:hypothetical protein